MTALKIALTGGIGSGKTAVTDYFRSLGIIVLDADEISHQLKSKKTMVIKRIVDAFGPNVLNPNKSLNRAALRQLVFTNPAARSQLETILHPEIQRHMQKAANRANTAYCVLSIPLLVETGQTEDFDRILVVEASAAIRRKRISHRSRLDANQIDAIFSAQVSDAERRKVADDLVINNGSFEALHGDIESLHRLYLQLATDKTLITG